jgi:hypothetical protein
VGGDGGGNIFSEVVWVNSLPLDEGPVHGKSLVPHRIVVLAAAAAETLLCLVLSFLLFFLPNGGNVIQGGKRHKWGKAEHKQAYRIYNSYSSNNNKSGIVF